MKLLVLALAACSEGQSLHDAVVHACETPPALAKIQNRDAIDALAAIAMASPSQRGAQLGDLMTRAGVTTCNEHDVAELARTTTYFGVAPPKLVRPCSPARIPSVRIERGQVVVGDRIASAIPATDLTEKVEYELDASGISNAIVVVDREVDGHLLAEVVGAIAVTDPRDLELVVDTGSCTGTVALAVGGTAGEHAPWYTLELAATSTSVVMSTQLAGLRVRTSDREFSVRKTKPDDLTELQRDLGLRLRRAEVVGEPRPSTLTIAIGAGVPAQRVLDTIVAVMRDEAGKPLFTRVRLAALD